MQHLTVILLFVAASARSQDFELNNSRLAVVEANNAFSTSLYQALSSRQGNLVVSPLSAATVLSMVWFGAGGGTARQLGAGLHLPESRLQVENGFKQLLTSLKSTDALTIKIANKMYIDKEFHVNDTFHQSVAENFLSDVEKLNLRNNPESSRKIINQWVEQQTQNKVKDLLPAGFLDTFSRLVLVNAVYFKGNWLHTFDESDTTSRTFYVTPGVNISVPMMHHNQIFAHGNYPELKFQALMLPYQGEACSMLLILPHDVDGLAQLETGIASLNLADIISNMTMSEVEVALPRFTIESTMNLKSTLQQIGIMDIFESPDLSGITTEEDIYVSKIVQKAFIEVTEKGTEAAAASAAMISNRIGLSNPRFVANHPFLFLILDERSGAILFMGRISRPSATPSAD